MGAPWRGGAGSRYLPLCFMLREKDSGELVSEASTHESWGGVWGNKANNQRVQKIKEMPTSI